MRVLLICIYINYFFFVINFSTIRLKFVLINQKKKIQVKFALDLIAKKIYFSYYSNQANSSHINIYFTLTYYTYYFKTILMLNFWLIYFKITQNN